jgi:hypothetical protein
MVSWTNKRYRWAMASSCSFSSAPAHQSTVKGKRTSMHALSLNRFV